MPEADAVAAAIAKVPLVVVSDMFATTDTARHAHVLLPALGWGEKSGTVTNSERRISRQRPFLPAPGAAKPDWWALAEVGRRLGHPQAFAYEIPAEIFREHVALSALAAAEGRDFDIAALAGADYDAMPPAQWPVGGPARFFADGRFFTADGKGRMIAVTQPATAERAPKYPLTLNTGRVRDHWHTMTRTGRSPRLGQHIAEPFAEIHPADAEVRGIGPADLVEVDEPPRPRPRPRPRHRPRHTGRDLRPDALVAASSPRRPASTPWSPATTDPHSGQPALKAGRAEVRRHAAAWFGFAVCRAPPGPGHRLLGHRGHALRLPRRARRRRAAPTTGPRSRAASSPRRKPTPFSSRIARAAPPGSP